MKIKTQDLIGTALDWAVAKCEEILDPVHGEPQPRVVLYSDQWDKYMRLNPPPQVYYSDRYAPSTDWAQGGPIVEQMLKDGLLVHAIPEISRWIALVDKPSRFIHGPTLLIAAMRCYVASKLDNEVDVPEELL